MPAVAEELFEPEDPQTAPFAPLPTLEVGETELPLFASPDRVTNGTLSMLANIDTTMKRAAI